MSDIDGASGVREEDSFEVEAVREWLAGQGTELTGEIEVKLWASSSALNTDFTANLLDVHPPCADWPGGFALNIA